MGHGFVIVAPNSGSGKTTIARGLMALFTRKGYRVQPFKCGPDYIDTKFHAAVCGRASINLDTFMATPEHVRELFGRYGKDADVCVVEGMMGMYDGYDRDKGSSAEIARVLDRRERAEPRQPCHSPAAVRGYQGGCAGDETTE